MSGAELWVTDGASDGAELLKGAFPGLSSSAPEDLAELDDRLHLQAGNGVSGVELWAADGAPDDAELVKSVRSGSFGSFPERHTELSSM